ncbi:RcnB family protein [Massilia sp. PAMC28688]|uniref:RcnB family protein n=1 Tax=Massilia sp. PAMC28688 TaxID=2861283 RepID=UPI001C6354BC|nr:RcnB family protein [Massilia sp. PAMC28688]QYF92140.1 RcnB family protein [Massilia sp. PAMC28688]
MFNKALAFAVTAACLTAGAAHAQSYDSRHDQRSQHYDRNGSYNDGSRHYDSRRDYRRDQRRADRYYGSRDGYQSHYDSRDYRYRNNGYSNGQRYHLRRGERLSHHHGRHVMVSDWRRHRGLYAPHRGHQWVQVGGDYALVAIATGLIAYVLTN